ncbi:winged helix-turn-helix domain-containing protein [Micromonospora yasonensis]|uniref:winged helix-turn-helix domain-containing protein n=1 Tax=Micromonospora yasonensis TaxID=1128667 RepID=UPI002232C25A|nr:winged helix-turn-helix domain-containing protein [Micromonospora yasonensis]MCW3840494.1 winged helix-turn-helix domain-containing protein [Micromonospora yasonensis]
MSVVAISPRPRRGGRVAPPRPRTAQTLTVTLDLGAGPLTPGLARLVDLLDELAGEGIVRAEEPAAGAVVGLRHPAEPPAPQPSEVQEPETVRILSGIRTVRQGGREIPLTRIEYDLLLFLAEHPRRVFTRLQLLANVWGYEHAVARTVDVHVRRLRAKLGVGTPLVTTVYGVGYRLADEARIVVDREG